jgi:hypothetical protein
MHKVKSAALIVAGLVLAASAAWAADVTGKWAAEIDMPNGNTRTTSFDFKVDRETLTGTVSGRMTEVPIEDGKLVGNDISFSVTRDWGRGPTQFTYTGTVGEGEIKLTVKVEGRDRTFEITLKPEPVKD